MTPPGTCRTGSRRIPGFSPCPHCGAVALRLLRAKPIICDGCGKERTGWQPTPRPADPRLVVLRLPRARQRHAPQCRDRGGTRLPSRRERGPMARQEQQGDAGMFGHDLAAEHASLAGILGHLGLLFRWPHRLRCDVIGILGRGLRLRARGRCGGANTLPLRTSTPFPCRRGPFRISSVPGSGAVWEVGTLPSRSDGASDGTQAERWRAPQAMSASQPGRGLPAHGPSRRWHWISAGWRGLSAG